LLAVFGNLLEADGMLADEILVDRPIFDHELKDAGE
jgi:hypothetical protein